MLDSLRQIAYNEGYESYVERILCLTENPYEGVSEELRFMFSEGWWDAFYEDL